MTKPGEVFLGNFRRTKVRALYLLVASVYWRKDLQGDDLDTILNIAGRARLWNTPLHQTVRRAFFQVVHDPVWKRCLDALRPPGPAVRSEGLPTSTTRL